ncbi:MAG: haloacid dehalogenase-like hydrolase [Sphingomonadales bacterium]|nr:haloacid dehalogenase-like hydrolase [Sphingomonadales bacterium]
MRLQTLNYSGIATVVVSASPTLFIESVCKEIGIKHVLGTELSYQNGKYLIMGKIVKQKKKVVDYSLFLKMISR